MVVTFKTELPTEAELEVEEVPMGAPYLYAGAMHLGKYCERENNEFMLCRTELDDPRKCVEDGKVVTKCTMDFFRKVKASCAAEFTQFALCLDRSSNDFNYGLCRNTQKAFDECMKANMNLERPHFGYYSLPKVHDTDRPMPVYDKRPDYLDDPKGGARPQGVPKAFPKAKPNYTTTDFF